jgi:hypothetical protein
MEDEDVLEPLGGPQAETDPLIREALTRLSDDALARLTKAAQAILVHHPRVAPAMAPGDLVNYAVQAVLEGRRKWNPKRVDFLGLLIGAMRSLASNATRIAATTTIETISYEQLTSRSDDDRQSLETIPSGSLTPEELLLETERQAHEEATLAMVRARLADAPDALAILDLLLKDVPKREIRPMLGMTDKRFWTADRRLTRAIEDVRMESNDK